MNFNTVKATCQQTKINTSKIIHDLQLRNCVTTAVTLVVLGFLPVGNSNCFSSTFYTNYYTISSTVAQVNACRRLVELESGTRLADLLQHFG